MGPAGGMVRMRFLLLVSTTVALLTSVVALVAGYISGEFDTLEEGVVWLRSLVESTLT